MADATGSMLISLHDGSRRPLPQDVAWSAVIHDGQAPSQWKTYNINGTGPGELIKGLPFFDNFFDNYRVVVSAKGFMQTGWMPVRISPKRVATVDLMLLPETAGFNFSAATWTALPRTNPKLYNFLRNGAKDDAEGETRYSTLMETHPASLACLLNIFTVMTAVRLPDDKTPLDFFWQIIWDDQSPFAMAQDRFYAYVDRNLVPAVQKAAAVGAFAPEPSPGAFHPGATSSYKQVQFDVTNLQLTFHERNTQAIVVQQPDGSATTVDCVVVEPDIDYYKDLLAHFFLEVVPNKFTGGLTDPVMVYMMRWMAGQQAGLADFDPPYVIA